MTPTTSRVNRGRRTDAQYIKANHKAMKTDKRTIAKYIRLYAVGTWGIISLLYIAGEPIDENMPIGEFCLLKLLGFISLGACVLVGKHLNRAGKLPDMEDNENECKI